MAERNTAEEDRRHSPRFKCGGEAKISRLPSDGIFVPGKIFDLSLGGCCVDTTLPIDFGVRTEMVVRVNAASFRAVGEVRAIRDRFGAGIEFVHLSTGGKHTLADLVTELARLQAVMNKLKAARREIDAESFRKQLEEGKRQAAILSERVSFLGTILRAESSGESSRESWGESPGESSEADQVASAGKHRIVGAQPLVITVDLFG
ncbi:MAG TPA: PilZ domain-containing protein [Terriglobales bacterium]|nr:PilZ domain-containing protein [Terriglobales bacterium]